MILKLQHVSVFFIKPSSGGRFVPNNVTFSVYLFLLPTYLKKPKHVGVLIS